ncbi:hypothetical protein RvY_18773 [Ramazzottius varieornatus]|uniref:PPPDE domain-containing protein n=1 Tax=Ramazzottius varieornatus TaxID=947166 RepID=A0A1D1W793_RAMVA|nr:hypothetical protein RvY_18773 [Ramazzottius varieornatus]
MALTDPSDVVVGDTADDVSYNATPSLERIDRRVALQNTRGLLEKEPKDCEELGDQFHYRLSLLLDHTTLTQVEVQSLLGVLAHEWHGYTYHVLLRNCNHFSDCLSRLLCGRQVLPTWVNRMANGLSHIPWLDRMVPKDWIQPCRDEENIAVENILGNGLDMTRLWEITFFNKSVFAFLPSELQDIVMSADPTAFDPSSFNPATKSVVRRTSMLVENRKNQKAEEEAEKLQQRKKKTSAAFQQGYGAELNPFILVDTVDSPSGKQPSDATTAKPQVVRRRILVEPVFSRLHKRTGHGESMFRQIILDQGITDTSLVEEIDRGDDNEYEMGTEMQLRNVHDYVDYSSKALVTGFIKEHAVGNILLSATFRYLVLLVILINAVLIGLGTDNYLSIKYGIYMEALENIIMAAFVIEILFKWYYNFEVFWKGGWNILDFVIVMILFFGSSLKFLGSSRVLRILRVIRAFRSLRDTPLFSGRKCLDVQMTVTTLAPVGVLTCLLASFIVSLIFQTVARSVSDMANIILLMYA